MHHNNFDDNKIATILNFIRLVLTCNNLTFQGVNYVQQTGTAMGTKMAPTYANLFMGHLEEQMLEETTLKPLIWFRFIDDIFFLRTFGEIKLQQFYELCNNFNPHIKFEQTTSPTNITFLDVQVILKEGKITTDLYTKPTDTHQYLNWNSCHPRHTKTAIPYSLSLRLRCICSSDELFETRARELHNILLERGYRDTLIRDSINKARQLSREEALRPNTERRNTERVPLVVPYNPALVDIRKIVANHHNILPTSQRCKEVFSHLPLIAYHKSRNLSDLLTSKRLKPTSTTGETTLHNDLTTGILNSTDTACNICHRTFQTNRNLKIHFSHRHKVAQISSNTEPGFWPCNKDSRCACCSKYGQFTQDITSSTTGECIVLRGHTTCETRNVIYLINCAKCKEQYEGETGNIIRTRANQHRSDITLGNKNIPTVRHFRNCGLDNFRLSIIERVRSNNQIIRRTRKDFWIQKLRPSINGQT